jgi:hypothetical protein
MPSRTVITQNTQSAWRPIGRRRWVDLPTTPHRWEINPAWFVCIREMANMSRWMKERRFASPKRSTTQAFRTTHFSGPHLRRIFNGRPTLCQPIRSRTRRFRLVWLLDGGPGTVQRELTALTDPSRRCVATPHASDAASFHDFVDLDGRHGVGEVRHVGDERGAVPRAGAVECFLIGNPNIDDGNERHR